MTMDINGIIGERVRFYRTAKDWSLERLATSLSCPISGQQLAKYETGVSRWPADLLCDIAITLKVDIRVLTAMERGKIEPRTEEELEAEKYKNRLLALPLDKRNLCYHTIAGMTKINKGE